jgi:hypothetical protein
MLNVQAAKHTVRSFINAPTVAAALWAARFALRGGYTIGGHGLIHLPVL